MTRLGWTFLGVLLFGLIGFLAMVRVNPQAPAALPAAEAGTATVAQTRTNTGHGLAIPVPGVRLDQIVDSFDDPRGGGTRRHGALDIPAPAGTPVTAAAAGMVEKLFHSEAGGNTIYIRSPDTQWIHYYAHLDSYAPHLAEGAEVRRGETIGTVGSSGNADPAAPHLHFEVKRMAPGEAWHQGSAVDPLPLLAR